MFHDPAVVAEARAHGQTDRLSRTSYEKPWGREASAARKENRKNGKKGKRRRAKKARNVANRQLLVPIGGFAHIKPTIKFRTREGGRTCLWFFKAVKKIFQRTKRHEEDRDRATAVAIGPGSEIFRIARSSLANVTVAGGSRDAPGHTLGVPSSIRWGSL